MTFFIHKELFLFSFVKEEDNESNYVYKYLEPVLAVLMADALILMQM